MSLLIQLSALALRPVLGSVAKMILPSQYIAPRLTTSQQATPCEAGWGLGLKDHLSGAPGLVRSSA